MNQAMSFLAQAASTMLIRAPQSYSHSLKPLRPSRILHIAPFPRTQIRNHPLCCTKLSRWEPSPVTYAPTEETGDDDFLEKPSNIFDTMNSDKNDDAPSEETGDVFLEKPSNIFDTKNSDKNEDAPPTEKTGDDSLEKPSNIFDTLNSDKNDEAPAPVANTEDVTEKTKQSAKQFQILKLAMWLLGPSLLLATGMVPTLWLPISSIFLGPNMVSLLSLIGLDFIFNLGATIFLLMADSCARSKNMNQASRSEPPLSYKFWNIVATVTGLLVPLIMLFGSQKGFLQPQLPFISSAVLLGPYILLLSVQVLTEMLTWHWKSPVWLVTPIVYESYRVLQLMRGLKLAAEVTAPNWMLHTIRGLVCWWVLILGVQLMRVAWFAGFTARARQQWSSPVASEDGSS